MTVKKTYYMDTSAMVFGGKLVVIGEQAFRSMMDNCKSGWMHLWLSGEFYSLTDAKEYFQRNWMK